MEKAKVDQDDKIRNQAVSIETLRDSQKELLASRVREYAICLRAMKDAVTAKADGAQVNLQDPPHKKHFAFLEDARRVGNKAAHPAVSAIMDLTALAATALCEGKERNAAMHFFKYLYGQDAEEVAMESIVPVSVASAAFAEPVVGEELKSESPAAKKKSRGKAKAKAGGPPA